MPKKYDEVADAGEYLDNLQVKGTTNMFGARPYLEAAYGLDKVEAGKILAAWMKTYGKGDLKTRVRLVREKLK